MQRKKHKSFMRIRRARCTSKHRHFQFTQSFCIYNKFIVIRCIGKTTSAKWISNEQLSSYNFVFNIHSGYKLMPSCCVRLCVRSLFLIFALAFYYSINLPLKLVLCQPNADTARKTYYIWSFHKKWNFRRQNERDVHCASKILTRSRGKPPFEWYGLNFQWMLKTCSVIQYFHQFII